MKERPILFSGPMARAILEGRKTQTRRIVKLRDPSETYSTHDDNGWPTTADEYGIWHKDRCPYGAPGDRLWCVTLKPIPSMEETHAAGDDGHIYRIDKCLPKKLKERIENGYHRVSINRGKEKICTAHELVCSAFYGKKPEARWEVRHLDGNRGNNCPENLDWGTPEQNWIDRKAHGRGVREDHHNAKINMQIAESMRSSGKTAWALSKEYGLNPKTIRNVLVGRTWTQPNPVEPNMPRWASRITLEITHIRTERLRAICQEDAIAEGIKPRTLSFHGHGEEVAPLLSEYRQLWESINSKGSWEKNPWVWVICFKRVETQGD